MVHLMTIALQQKAAQAALYNWPRKTIAMHLMGAIATASNSM
jgi:hypothetical protein